MEIAYLIRAHHRPEQLGRLVRRLATANSRFYVHVSRLTGEAEWTAMQRALEDVSAVTWLPRVAVRYPGFGQVEAVLVGLAEIARERPVPTFTVLLSGQDYPLRPPAEIERWLADRRGATLLEHFRLPADVWSGDGGLDRIRYFHLTRVRVRGQSLRLPLLRRRFPPGYVPYGGSAWGALSAEAVRYVDGFARENQSFVRWFRYAFIPDELFLQTVLLNSPLRETVVDEQVHHIDWRDGGLHPTTFTTADFDQIQQSRKLFARKFDVEVDPTILDVIDERLLHVAATT